MIYYDKLKAFCEGLEMENIEMLMTKSPEFFNAVGKTMSKRIKERTSNYRTTANVRFGAKLLTQISKLTSYIRKRCVKC